MDWDQLDALCSDLTAATEIFKDLYNSNRSSLTSRNDSLAKTSILSATLSGAGDEISAARKNLCGILTRLHTLVAGPSCFIHQLATQNQLLACLKWLGEFQVIACVPLSGSVSIQELADLADVPEFILSRMLRMTATAGFLHEPEPGYVAHTALSAAFSTELSYFDAAMFLSNNVAPSALHLTSVTQKQDGMPNPTSSWNDISSAYMIALNSPHSFASACAEAPQLSRQWSAYCHNLGALDDSLTSLLSQLNWQSLGEASIVYVCARYTESSKALLQMSRALRVIVQTYEFTPPDVHMATSGRPESEESMSRRIAVQRRKPTEPQSVKDAAVYILQPSLSPLITNGMTSRELLTAELQSHVNVLRANPSALLVFAPTLLPEPGSVAVTVEIQARLRDFAHLQLGNESALEVTELVKLIEGVGDRHGRLMVTNRLRSLNGATIALAVQYQSFAVGEFLMVQGDSAMNSDTYRNLG